MAGTKQGAVTRRNTMIKNVFNGDEQAYLAHQRKLASIGGQNGNTGGFFQNRELARRAGRIGGSLSRRTK